MNKTWLQEVFDLFSYFYNRMMIENSEKKESKEQDFQTVCN